MYLKTLELFGFKSFADRTIVQFHEGITAIVGPNGCGKSNVLDSMRWVLGEQSAKALRGGEMTDVIFNGTDDRKPLNMAEVSLTFADCEKELGVDWSEVRVTRRVFRDGKSEYLLNNVGCRLKDIQTLFMDTGIGRSAYSIMEQGKIDQILSSRPEDRRAVFEEAAGITKFKAQKKEALRKLEHTEGNLIRVGDVIREVKRQIGSLQRQAGKARRYQSLMSDLQIMDTHLNRVRYDSLREEERGIQEALERLGLQLDSHQGRLSDFESNIAKQRLTLAEIEERAEIARQKVQTCQSAIQGKRSRIEFNRERVIEFNALIRRYGEEVEEASTRLVQQNEELQRLETEITEAAQRLADDETGLASRSGGAEDIRQRRIAAERASEELRQKVASTDNRIFSLRSEVSNNRTLNETLDARLAALNHERATLQETEQTSRTRLEDARAQLESARAQLADLKDNGESAQSRHSEATAALRAAEQELAAVSKEIASREMRRETLLELNTAGDGAGEGAQEILQGLGDSTRFARSIHGLLPSLLEVEPGFVHAVEAALGPQLDVILVDQGEAFDEIVQRFNGGQLGRAAIAPDGFGPLREEADSVPTPNGVLARAVEKVRALPKAHRLLERLLRDVFIVESLEQAISLKAQGDGAFATLDGAFISHQGVIHAGRQAGAAQSLLQRKSVVAEIERELKEFVARHDELTARRDAALREQEAAQATLDELRERYQDARLSVGVLERQISDGDRELQNLVTRAETLDRESQQQIVRQQAALAKVSEMESLVETESGSIGQLRTELEQANTGLEELRSVESQHMLDVGEARVAVATSRQRIEGLNAQKRPLQARIEELNQLMAARGRDAESYKQRISESEEESARLSSEIETESAELATAETQVGEVLAERESAGAVIAESERELRAIREMVDTIRTERGQYEVRQTQAGLKSDNLRDYVVRRYQIDIEDFKNDSYALLKTIDGVRKARVRSASRPEGEGVDEIAVFEAALTAPEGTPEGETLASPVGNPMEQPIDWEFVEQMVDELTQKLDAMGPVNLDAIQEFAELEERYAFLEQQNSDLMNAKEELLEAIARINRTTEELFSETFARLREHFQLMFRELFGGGKADLALMDSQDPLECGIEIIAKPPGKQPQAISLLSGGERAMTAVALLFAIYMVKPSPFCVLDEMDAPLDDSNINRFVKILEQFAAQSQFVVISHNKRTIAKSNYLYGVTMESKGVSKLVGVRFSKGESGTNGNGKSNGSNTDVLSSSEPPSISEAFGKSGNLHSEDLAAALEFVPE
jgi:chromosome segregation protein